MLVAPNVKMFVMRVCVRPFANQVYFLSCGNPNFSVFAIPSAY